MIDELFYEKILRFGQVSLVAANKSAVEIGMDKHLEMELHHPMWK